MPSLTLPVSRIRSIEEDYPDWQQMAKRPRGAMQVPTRMIVGTFGINSGRFDSEWMPKKSDTRYDDIYSYAKERMELPKGRDPIMLFKIGRDYYVSDDGNRRVAVAHRLKMPVVEAEIIELVPAAH